MSTYRDIVKRKPVKPKPIQLPSLASLKSNGPESCTRILKRSVAVISSDDMQKAIEYGIDWAELASGRPINELIKASVESKPVIQTMLSPTEDPSYISDCGSGSGSIPTVQLPDFTVRSNETPTISAEPQTDVCESKVLSPPVTPKLSTETQTENHSAEQESIETQTENHRTQQESTETQTDIHNLDSICFKIISEIVKLKYPSLIDIETIIIRHVYNLDYSENSKIRNKVSRFIHAAKILPRGVCEPLYHTKIENGCKKVIYRASYSCPPNIGRTYISQINRKNCHFVTTETESPVVLNRVLSSHTIQTYSSLQNQATMNQTYKEVVLERDTFASETTRIPLKDLTYSNSLFTRFHGKAYKKWCNLDAKCNKLMFDSSEFNAEESLQWILYINGVKKGVYASEKNAKDDGKKIVSDMQFPYAISVFQIPSSVFEITDYNEQPVEESPVEEPPVEEPPVEEPPVEEPPVEEPPVEEPPVEEPPVEEPPVEEPPIDHKQPIQINNISDTSVEFINNVIGSIENNMYIQNRAIYELSDKVFEIYGLLTTEPEQKGFWSELFDMLGCPRRRRN